MTGINSFTPSPIVAEFTRRCAEALSRRIGHGKGMNTKQAAWQFQVSETLIYQWLAGTKMPSGPKLVELIAFFDASFAHEILQPLGKAAHDPNNRSMCEQVERDDATAKALRALAAVAPILTREDAA